MSLLDRIAPTARSESHLDGRPSYAMSFGYGLLAPAAFALLVLVPVLASWTLDPRTSTQWADALAVTASVVGLSLRGSVSVPHNGIEAVHLSPMLLVILLAVLTRWAFRPVQNSLVDGEVDARGHRVGTGLFLVGWLVSAVAISALSRIGSAPVTLWTVVPGALIIATVGIAWAIWRDAPDSPLAQDFTERVHLHVRRGFRPAMEGLGLLLAAGTVLAFGLFMAHLDRVGKISALLDVSGGTNTALLWLTQLLVVPNLIIFAASWMTGAPLALGAGDVTLTTASPTVLPSIPVFGAFPEAGPLPIWTRIVWLVPVAIGAFVGWRASASMSSLTHVGRKVQVAAIGSALLVATYAVLVWWSRAGMSPGRLDLLGPSAITVGYAAVEVIGAAALTAAAVHYLRVRR